MEMTSTQAVESEAGEQWTALSPTERESFFAAIERHRKAAWRVTAVSAVGIIVAAFVVAVLAAPLFYALLGLAFDVANIVTPTPNLIGDFIVFVDSVQSDPAPVTIGRWAVWLSIAALPGAAGMTMVILSLRRALISAAHFESSGLATRQPDPTVLAEQRFVNVIQEMAIAANLPAPAVVVADAPTVNAAVFGHDEEHATIVVPRGLLARMNRAELQGIAAHLIASIANGDMRIGERAALTLAFFNLVSRFATIMGDRQASRSLMDIFKALLLPTRNNVQRLVAEVSEGFKSNDMRGQREVTLRDRIGEGAKLALGGPVIMTGFFGGIVNAAMLGPLLAFAWRQRKYMADATAVRLTRDPDTLGSALEKISSAGGGGVLTTWASHLSVSAASTRNFLGGTAVPMFPSLERRLRALHKLGATPRRPTSRRQPLKVTVLITFLYSVVLMLVCALLPLLVLLSTMLSMLFLGLPVSILHVLLRWLGH
jgi:Zn-dependent protease with chaperone function